MTESEYDVRVERWTCSVSNQHRKAFGDRKVRQRTSMRLEGSVATPTGQQTAAVYLTFERGAQEFSPTITATDDPKEAVRVDAFLAHGQEAAVLVILTSGYRTWGRFRQNALGQTSFVLESGEDSTGKATPESHPPV